MWVRIGRGGVTMVRSGRTWQEHIVDAGALGLVALAQAEDERAAGLDGLKLVQGVAEAEVVEETQRAGVEHDTGTGLVELMRCLVDVDVQAGHVAMTLQGDGEA